MIPGKPAGLFINGTDPGIAQAIKKAVAAGIPTVVYDSEIPNSDRHCFIGSDWYEMGRLQGERMAKLINGKGKVACMGILGMENMESLMGRAERPWPSTEPSVVVLYFKRYTESLTVTAAPL